MLKNISQRLVKTLTVPLLWYGLYKYNKKYKIKVDNIIMNFNILNSFNIYDRKNKVILVNTNINERNLDFLYDDDDNDGKRLKKNNKIFIYSINNISLYKEYYLYTKILLKINKLFEKLNFSDLCNKIILLNSYGDIKILNEKEINSNNKYHILSFFERIPLLNNINKITNLKLNDFILLYTNTNFKKNLNIFNKEFIIYRFLFYNIVHNLNVYFYALINNNILKSIKDDNNLDMESKIYLLYRKKKYLQQNDNVKILNIDNEEFIAIDFTCELNHNNLSEYMKMLVNKGNFYYYLKSNQEKKSLVESLNLLFKDKGYYLLCGNLYKFYESHMKQLNCFIEEYKKSNLINDSAICFADSINYNNEKIGIIQLFKDKYFDVKTNNIFNSLKNIPFYDPRILKKKFVNIDNINWYKDIQFKENNIFSHRKLI